MSSDIAISVKGLGKSYHIYKRPQDRLKQSFLWGRKKLYEEFWAVKDVNLDIKRGETVGIIGRNGSGKSTLLQIICGTLKPSAGEVEVNGRIAALLELGSGFDPEFSGKENVYLNAAILGLEREEIDERYESIIEFADIGDFIHQPVKTYSSGMYVRLAFAVVANVDPDILVVDEALSVGDIFFVQKCIRKFEEFREKGVTIVYVSHDMNSIRKDCQRVVLLDKGNVVEIGDPKEIVDVYNALDYERIAAEVEGVKEASAFDIAKRRLNSDVHRYGTRQAEIKDVTLFNEKGEEAKAIESLKGTRIRIKTLFLESFDDIVLGITIRNRLGVDVYMTNTEWKKVDVPSVGKDSELEFSFTQDMDLNAGEYTITVALSQSTPKGIKRLDWVADCISFHVLSQERFGGICNLNSSICVK